jgi:hypothetical protein
VTTRQLAKRVIELYWPQTAPYAGEKVTAVLAQIRGGQAEIVRAIRTFRERVAGDPSEPLSRARARHLDRYERLLKMVEWKLIEMPLPRLQVIGQVQTEFLYRIGWDTRVQRQDVKAGEFDRPHESRRHRRSPPPVPMPAR